MDVHTPEQRSRNMAAVKSKGTRPEKTLFKLLYENGFKFETYADLPGRPDVTFPKNKIALFIDGEYWHGKNFELWNGQLSEFWLKKIGDNIKRDRRNDRHLRNQGWKVIHFWGRYVLRYPERTINRIRKAVNLR